MIPEKVRNKPLIVAIIQARMNSSRLPGKVLKDLCGMPILSQLIRRVEGSNYIDEIVVATTVSKIDNPIAELCDTENISVFRGSEHDVLERMVLSSQNSGADIIVRLTADNPFVNAELIDLILFEFLSDFPELDYMSNTEHTNFPHGLYVEVIKASSLKKINAQKLAKADREHVTTFIRNNPSLFRMKQFYSEFYFPYKYLSIDTEEDYERLVLIFKMLKEQSPNFGLMEISKLAERSFN